MNIGATSSQNGKPSRKHEWAPRMWEGCDFFAWLRLLARNRFAVHWSHLYIAIIITFVSFFHTILRHLQEFLYGEEIAQTPIREAPVFIIGHWRTGTTLLHELLIQDERHNFPNTYECMDPNHFLLTESFFRRWLPFLMPKRRPMDNMAAGWERPQEDEFALCNLGQPSPYLTVAFPNNPPQYWEYYDLERLPARALRQWRTRFHQFLRHITYKDSRRLILKSPPHSCRVRVLLGMFPDARFIHIVRNPYVVFPSTVNLWKTLYHTHGLQRPTLAGLEDLVFATFRHLYTKLGEGMQLIAPGRFYELRYEDLIQDQIGEMRKLYQHLDLGDFTKVQPRLEQYLEGLKGYETNRYQLSTEKRAEIDRHWGDVIRRYGYEVNVPVNGTGPVEKNPTLPPSMQTIQEIG